ncbi:YcaO-like family protein [Corynebacterium sp. CCM 9185]|uniref:YcaO-like family protein n=1 Tax=Corynebacterium marambiense TaxID=2765364 RepID=A0ABS0VXZ4_9CORY|nr:YcaO-like family protein [Corynebacterium marambiense]MCK7663807.1 YcaO-like family protein [Corynebacterium marambiense]
MLSTSSGCATGYTVAEAAFSGLLELIGRDAYGTSWYTHWSAALPGGPRFPVRAQLPGVKVEACPLTSSFGVPVGIAPVHADTISSIGTGYRPGPLKALDVVINVAWTYTPDRMSMGTCDPDRIKRLSENSRLVHDIDDHPCCAAPKRTRSIGASVGVGKTSA